MSSLYKRRVDSNLDAVAENASDVHSVDYVCRCRLYLREGRGSCGGAFALMILGKREDKNGRNKSRINALFNGK